MNLDLIITLYYYFGVSRSLRLLKVASLVSAVVNHCTRRIYFVIRAWLHANGRMCVCFRERKYVCKTLYGKTAKTFGMCGDLKRKKKNAL